MLAAACCSALQRESNCVATRRDCRDRAAAASAVLIATSKGPARVEFAKYLREYWRLAGFTLRTRKEAGFLVTGPDYYVLRLSLASGLDHLERGDVEKLNQVHRILNRIISTAGQFWRGDD